MPENRAALVTLLQEFALETERFIAAASAHEGLHRTDLGALGVMAAAATAGRTVTPGALRQKLSLSSPATTALIDRLSAAGHLTRARSNSDRRQVHLELTEKSRRTGSKLFAPLAGNITTALESFSEDEAAMLCRMLEKVIEATATARTSVA